MQHNIQAQICLGSPDVTGEQYVCPGNSYNYSSSADIGFPYRFNFVQWTTNSGNALVKINGTDTRFYASKYLVHSNLTANDITLIENYYPTAIKFLTIGFDNDEITLYYNQPGYSQIVVTSVRPDYKNHALPKSVDVNFGNRTRNIIDYQLRRNPITGGNCDYFINRTLYTRTTFVPANVAIKLTSPQLPTCGSGGNFDIRESNITFPTNSALFNWKLIDPLGNDRTSLISGNKTTNNVYIPYLERPGTWNLTCTVTSCLTQTFSFPINVASPFALQPAEIRVDGVNNYTYASLYPSCPKAHQSGYQLSVPAYTNVPDVQYTWTLPPGWRTYNAPASSSTVVGGYVQSTYRGQYLNNLSMDSYVKANGTIPGGDGQLVIRACNVTSSPIIISVIPNGPLDVRLNPQVTSCLPSVLLEPVVVAQAYPVTIGWQSTNGGSFASATTDGFAPANTFTATPGTYQVKLNITDARQCMSDYTNTTVIIGGPGVNSAGWNSGILSDVNNWNVISNLSVTDNSDVYFVGQDKVTGAASLQYYRFDAGFAKWVPTPAFPQPTSGVRAGTNSIAVASGTALGIYYVDAADNIKRLTGSADIPVPAGKNADVIKVDPAGTFNTARLVYRNNQTNFIHSWNPVTSFLPALPFISLATKYDIGINNGRVFYVNAAESAIYYKELSDNNSSNKGTLMTSLYSINCYTDIVFDANGNMYYATCDGNIFVCKKNLGNMYDAPVSIQIASNRGCDGHFTINASTGTIYYTGYDNRLYQQYVIDFTNNQWLNVPATQSFGDIAGRSLVFKTPHLFYIGDNNLVYNLYYFQGCTPSPLRVAGADTDHIQSENQIYTEGNVLLAAIGKAFPNPFTDHLTVFVEGSGVAELKVSDVHGKALITKEYSFEETSFSTTNLSAGMYLCTIIQNGKILYTAKVIKQ